MRAELNRVRTWLVRCPNWVGDIVMATPVFECLRANFPKARIVGAVRRYARGIIEHGPWFDAVLDCNDKTLGGFWAAVRETRDARPDAALLLPNSTHAFLTVRLAGVRNIYGYRRNLRRFLLTGGPAPQRERHRFKPVPMQDYYLELCRFLELELPQEPRCRLYLSPDLERQGHELLARHGIQPGDRVIGLNPGASFGSSKCWPPEYFARLAEDLEARFSGKLLLFIGPGEESIGETIVAKSRAALINTGPDRVDLALLKPLVRRCQLLVTNDTGPRHYAAAFGVPAVVLMGPTNPVYTARNLDHTVVIRRELECSPCHKKICPIDHRCMTGITPEMVLATAERLLQGEGQS